MKGFKDSEGKFHPITDKKGVRMKRDKSIKTTGIRLQSEITQKNPYLTEDFKTVPDSVKNMEKVLSHDKLFTDPDHITGKIDDVIALDGYRRTNEIKRADRTATMDRGTVFTIGNSDYVEEYLKRVAVDARLNHLLPNERLETLFDKAKFYTSDEPDRTVMIRIKGTSYFIAPYVREEGY